MLSAAISIFSFIAGPKAQDVNALVLKQFRTHSMVALGEQHQCEEQHAFLRRLLADPRTARVVNDIVVEAGNALYQPVVDRFVAGEDVSETEVAKAWRNTTQWLVWDAPVYRKLYEAVRSVNKSLPQARKFRLVLADPPVDWGKVKTAEDFRQYAARDPDWFRVVKREVFAKNRKALLICGGLHVTKRAAHAGETSEHPNVAELIERDYPGRLWSVIMVSGPGAAMELGRPQIFPSLKLTAKAPIGSLSFAKLLPKNLVFFKVVNGRRVPRDPQKDKMRPIKEMIDALIFVSRTNTTSIARRSTYDESYVRDLRRRAPILKQVFGFDFEGELDEALGGGAAVQER